MNISMNTTTGINAYQNQNTVRQDPATAVREDRNTPDDATNQQTRPTDAADPKKGTNPARENENGGVQQTAPTTAASTQTAPAATTQPAAGPTENTGTRTTMPERDTTQTATQTYTASGAAERINRQLENGQTSRFDVQA